MPTLTPEGMVHPAMQGLSVWFGGDGQKASKELPPVRGNVVVPKAKSGAQVLLTHADRPGPDGKPQIVLAVEHYGQGRSAAFTVDTTYLWYRPLAGMGQDSPYKTFWGQIVRSVGGEVAPFFTTTTEPPMPSKRPAAAPVDLGLQLLFAEVLQYFDENQENPCLLPTTGIRGSGDCGNPEACASVLWLAGLGRPSGGREMPSWRGGKPRSRRPRTGCQGGLQVVESPDIPVKQPG